MEREELAIVTILLLGDPLCGKSTFFSSLTQIKKWENFFGTSGNEKPILQTLQDSNQPFEFTINRGPTKFHIHFYDTASSDEHWMRIQPQIVILAYDISNRETISGLKSWRNEITRLFQTELDENTTIVLLGLKRDLRSAEDPNVIYPEEAYRIAQELHCDTYAECSALTGELIPQVFEDVSELAVKTLSGNSGNYQPGCTVS